MNSAILACIIIPSCTLIIAAGIILFIINKYRANLSIYPEDKMIGEVKDRFIFIRALHKCDTWFNASIFWLIVEYLGAILPFELSAAILYLENSSVSGEEKQKAIIAFSVLSMALIIIDFAIRPHVHMEGNRKAFINIDYAISTYIVDKTHNEKTLLDAMIVGENLVNSGYGINYTSIKELKETTPFIKFFIKNDDETK